MKKEIAVLSPATIANVVCGFDVMGFALSDVYDRIVVRLLDEPEIRIINHDPYELPVDPELNVFGGALKAVMNAWPETIGFEVESTKMIKPGSGIGSSAASAAGVVVAANHLLGEPFTKSELIRFAMAGEAIASKAEHADNIAPAIYGGFTLVRSLEPLDIVPLNYPELHVAVIHPQVEIRTSESRALIPAEIPVKTAIRQWANVGGLVAGLASGDYDGIGQSMIDLVAEPARKSSIPGFAEMAVISKELGAIGGGIAGSGPSLFYFCRDKATAQAIANASRSVYQNLGISCFDYVTTIASEGVRVLVKNA